MKPSRSSLIARHTLLIGSSLFMLAPFVWMVSLSFRSPEEIFTAAGSLLPHEFYGFENYRVALSLVPFGRFMFNGAFVAACVLILQIAIAAPCAYALAKFEFRGKAPLFGLIFVSLLIPQEILGLPLFNLFNWLGLLDSYAGLILPYTISPFAIFLFHQFFKTIPDDLIHAARIDGMSELSIVWRVMLPMAAPAVLAFSILSVVSRWNGLFWPLIAVSSESLMPPSVGILYFRDEEAGNAYGPLMAAAVLVVSPLVLAFLLAQRRFVEGMTLGGVK
jgi:multiple sugar transport system permease protein